MTDHIDRDALIEALIKEKDDPRHGDSPNLRSGLQVAIQVAKGLEEPEPEPEPEPTIVTMQFEQSLFYKMGYVLREGLTSIQEKLRELDIAYNAVPQHPKLTDKLDLPLLADVPIDRDAMWRVIVYYKDREANALELIKLYEKARGY